MLYLLIILGFVLRLVNIDKPEGLWNDEYVSWMISATPFNQGFFDEILKQCHMPLYYLYLKPFSSFSDFGLRFTSLIPSLISIIVMYKIGKQYSKKLGLICAGITSTLPFLIYYSQEVRFYSLLFLFSSLSLLFTIKQVKNNNGFIGYIVFNILILLTHVLGGIYVFLNICYVCYRKKRINLSKSTIIISAICLGILIFFGINILKMLPNSQWWGRFSYTNILFLFSDFFSPILSNNVNAPVEFFYYKNLFFNFLLTIPTVIAFIGIVLGAKKEKGFAVIALGVILGMIILTLSGKLVFITKYAIEILPILILLLSLGFENVWKNIVLYIFILINLFSVFTPYYPSFQFRKEGNKLVGDILNAQNPDVIIYTYYAPNRFKRYLKINPKTEVDISKNERFNYLDNTDFILKDLKNGTKVSMVFLDSVSFIPKDYIELSKQTTMPEMFITYSSIKQSLQSEFFKISPDAEIKKDGEWSVLSGKVSR